MIFRTLVAKTKLVEQLILVTLQTADLGSTARESRHHNGITIRGLSQPTFATKRPFLESVFSNYVIDFTKSAIRDRNSSSDGMSMSRATYPPISF